MLLPHYQSHTLDLPTFLDDNDQKTIVNALLTTLHVLAGSATGGMHLAHIALATLGITAASDARNDVKCFLFHDEDSANELGNYEFGRLVAVRLLAAFTDAYAAGGALGACVNKAAFGAFAARLLDVIAGADRDILRELRCTPGVSNCIVVADAAGASTAAALGHQATVAASEIEEIGFLANFRSFVAYSEELSLCPRRFSILPFAHSVFFVAHAQCFPPTTEACSRAWTRRASASPSRA